LVAVAPRTRSYVHGIQWSGLDYYYFLSWLVHESYTKLAVDLRLVGWVCFVEHADDVVQCGDHGGDLLSGHAPGLRALGQPGFGEGALSLDFGHPRRDNGRVSASFEGGSVLAEFGVAVGDVLAGLLGCQVVLRVFLGLCEFGDGVREQRRAELGG
jgi:hypothetical protein